MHAADLVGAVEVGERARHAQHAMIAARREPHGVGGVAQERKPARVRPRHLFEQRTLRGRVGAAMPPRGWGFIGCLYLCASCLRALERHSAKDSRWFAATLSTNHPETLATRCGLLLNAETILRRRSLCD